MSANVGESTQFVRTIANDHDRVPYQFESLVITWVLQFRNVTHALPFLAEDFLDFHCEKFFRGIAPWTVMGTYPYLIHCLHASVPNLQEAHFLTSPLLQAERMRGPHPGLFSLCSPKSSPDCRQCPDRWHCHHLQAHPVRHSTVVPFCAEAQATIALAEIHAGHRHKFYGHD